MSRNLVILLHGVGSNGADLAGLGAMWRKLLPNTAFAAPDGPLSFGPGPGRQWFSVNGVTEANRPERVAAARPDFDQTLSNIIAAHGLANQLDRVALVGFSQGSIMALDALASGRWPVAAVVAFSGRLASQPPLSPAKNTRLLLIHGTADPVMPASESERTRTVLQGFGVDTTTRILPGVGHTITAEGAALAEAFLAETFESTDPKQQ
jgi:phospholipase/carboxylesterase